jgi:hypothetical protein
MNSPFSAGYPRNCSAGLDREPVLGRLGLLVTDPITAVVFGTGRT